MQTKVTVEAGDLDMLQKLLGTFDENLNIVARELNVFASIEGTCIKISGEEGDVSCAQRVLEGMLRLVRAGEGVDKSRIAYCIELAREGGLEGIEEVMGNVVAFTSRGKPVKCKTLGQSKYVDAIKKNTVVFGIGPAGTGKTYLAVCLAVSAFKAKQVEKIVLTRPAVEAGEKLGFLPGDLQTKVDPYLRPLYDALFEMLGEEKFNRCLERGIIEVAPLAYMRGRTLADSWIIVDESQNASLEQLLMVLTRLGEGSKIVVTGDITQVDLKDKASGLDTCSKILHGIDKIGIVKLNNRDVVRHKLVKDIIKAFEKYQEQTEKTSAKTGRKKSLSRYGRQDAAFNAVK